MKRKTVCVDLDGVLAEYNGWKGIDHIGNPLPGAKEFLTELIKHADVAIFTTRTNSHVNKEDAKVLVDRIQLWLLANELPYTRVVGGAEGKPLADAYIDDRAVACRPQEDSTAFQKALDQAIKLVGTSTTKNPHQDIHQTTSQSFQRDRQLPDGNA